MKKLILCNEKVKCRQRKISIVKIVKDWRKHQACRL